MYLRMFTNTKPTKIKKNEQTAKQETRLNGLSLLSICLFMETSGEFSKYGLRAALENTQFHVLFFFLDRVCRYNVHELKTTRIVWDGNLRAKIV